MAEQFRISRYRADDRQRVLDFIVTVHPRAFADRLIQQWSWRYEENPFNREAARYREAHREEVLAHLDRVFSRDRFERFCRKWSIDPHDGRGDAFRCRSLSVRALHPVLAGRHNRVGNFCFGDDRGRHHFH